MRVHRGGAAFAAADHIESGGRIHADGFVGRQLPEQVREVGLHIAVVDERRGDRDRQGISGRRFPLMRLHARRDECPNGKPIARDPRGEVLIRIERGHDLRSTSLARMVQDVVRSADPDETHHDGDDRNQVPQGMTKHGDAVTQPDGGC